MDGWVKSESLRQLPASQTQTLSDLLAFLDRFIVPSKYRSDSTTRFMFVVVISMMTTISLLFLLTGTLFCYETQSSWYLWGFPVILAANSISLLVYRFTIMSFAIKNSASLLHHFCIGFPKGAFMISYSWKNSLSSQIGDLAASLPCCSLRV
jgi:hypothetical protein